MRLAETLRAAWVIARRDFLATVLSKSFIFFLVAPLFPLIVGLLFTRLGTTIEQGRDAPILAVAMPQADVERLFAARRALLPILTLEDGPALTIEPAAPGRDPSAILGRKRQPVVGVLDGTLERPRFSGAVAPDGRMARTVGVLVDEARRIERNGSAAPRGEPVRFALVQRSSMVAEQGREITARAAQGLQFLLTLLLAGMLLSQLVEEKSNKVIEVLAAAVPIDSIFLGKLFAMLATSLVGIALWGMCGALALSTWVEGGLSALPEPAVGWPLFAAFGLVYFSMSYLLLGAAFLGIGSQASTVREVQTMSMPVTMSQMLIFAMCAAAVGRPNSNEGMVAAFIPFSSPFAMLARAAEQGGYLQHVVALVWQGLWVILILRVASRYFRRNVLKSGPTPRSWWRRRRA